MDLDQYRCLARHFFRGYLENDLLSPDEGMQASLAPLLAAAAAPGVVLPALWSFSYGWPFSNAAEFQALAQRHELLLVAFPMFVVGLVTVLQWDSLYPDARDRAVLGLQPVPLRTIFLAKATALAAFVGLFALVVNGSAAICYPAVANVKPQLGSPGVVLTFVAHVAATFGACAFTTLFVLAAFGGLQLVLPSRLFRLASSAVQLGGVLVLVFSLLMLPLLLAVIDPDQQGKAAELVSLHRLYWVEGEGTFDWLHPPASSKWVRDTQSGGMRLRSDADMDTVRFRRERRAIADGQLKTALAGPAVPASDNGASWAFWCPPLWFVGWYEVLAGRGGPTPRLLAGRATAGLLGAALLAVAFYLLAYARQAPAAAALGGRSTRGHRRARKASALRRRLGILLLPDPVARAACAFTLKTTVRSARHRLILAAAVGVALALALADLAARLGGGAAAEVTPLPPVGVLALQPLLLSLLIVAARVSFGVPSVLDANWVFRFNGPEAVRSYLSGARRAVFACCVAPVLLALAPLHLLLLGWRAAGLHALLGLLNALILLEVLLLGYRKIPFAAAYVPGKARLRSRLLPYVLGFQAYVYVVALVESWALSSGSSCLVTSATLGAIYLALAGLRGRLQRGNLVFDEEPPDAIQTLDLAGPVKSGWADEGEENAGRAMPRA